MDCGILFSTYDLLISSKPLSKEEKARLKAAKAAEKWTVAQGKDDGAADKIQFGVRPVSDAVLCTVLGRNTDIPMFVSWLRTSSSSGYCEAMTEEGRAGQ